jgi:uncharacterized protein (DUF1684 family)
VAPASYPLSMSSRLDLLDWKRRIFDLYSQTRNSPDVKAAWQRWCAGRDELFRLHPQSPLREEVRERFSGIRYFDYDPRARALGEILPAAEEQYEIGASDGGTYGFTRFTHVRFNLYDSALELELYWLDGYGGGLFLPFRDATAGVETYGAGRYLLDTVKGADLGMQAGKLVLDFNFAYSPSCAYDPRWSCPLAPPPTRLELEVRAGERFG